MSDAVSSRYIISQKIYSISYRPPLLIRIYSMSNGGLYNPAIAYPYREPIFSSLTAGLVASLIPLAIILLAQVFIRSFADAAAAIKGLLYALVTGTFFQVILKTFIGGPRPHFIAVCEPISLDEGQGPNANLYTPEICLGSNKGRINYALQTFPSGHAEAAFAGLGFLAIYLYTHLRIGDPRVESILGFWRMAFVLTPIILATYLSATLVLVHHHFAFDSIFGAGIGILTALLGYRLAFRGLTSYKTNCEPRIGKRLRKEMDKRREEAKEASTPQNLPGPSATMDGAVDLDDAGEESETVMMRRRVSDEEMGNKQGCNDGIGAERGSKRPGTLSDTESEPLTSGTGKGVVGGIPLGALRGDMSARIHSTFGSGRAFWLGKKINTREGLSVS
ncbi:hypothetical protein LTR47_005839 [Exophiala xenobiotica]|nr:hypothetical protein LTR92_008189 [Exophiala xenobiotica]KAK5232975.1 hypothetical protein LTR47_005839 [Exophiala xenobiotica]KAK5243740.1 hypothetical protein LTS06_010555 [Exophiala xenobiotica]KAK5322457.1 hypothetical protein LTR93_005660 [Exophiala xenobiotica]KAK5350983.1 hypothetical protein LTR61_005336 [Exophiala xenobiotica]